MSSAVFVSKSQRRLFEYAKSIGCVVEHGKKHFKIMRNDICVMTLSHSRDEIYDISSQERKLQRMIANVKA